MFEFDDQKSLTNKEKHGISFVEAQELWTDGDYLEFQSNVSDEPRNIVIGRINGKIWTAIITYRGENIRIISVRRARTKEIELYES